ncbi:ATP-dependent DNA helicase RecG [Bacteroides graminisolvens DSM 19988 = JCM 15093]|uniref:ATP-dependent DNA helicase RecG n=1 Tax=Bacteroides graminisolvens DSM 19988 = JCM 15093 TaxID=1121097 RepID=A0A069D326_9BACE|nr:ATP-dependent DNA helicase RecG [Bacteroides graminisolvens DSM 19988 = JCM 15093]
MAFDLKIADLARDGQLLQYVREIATSIVDSDPNANLPENEVSGNNSKRYAKQTLTGLL